MNSKQIISDTYVKIIRG